MSYAYLPLDSAAN